MDLDRRNQPESGSPASPCWAASDELDSIIAVIIMGWNVHPRNTAHWMKATDSQIDYRPVAHTCGSDRWAPTRNLLDAWRVVERITTPCVGSVDGMPWATRFAHLFRDADLWACNREEAAKGICLLAIRASGIELPPNAPVHRAGE